MNYKQYGQSPVSDENISTIDLRLQNISEGITSGETIARIRSGRVIGFGLVSIAYAINNCAKVYYEVHKKTDTESDAKIAELTEQVNYLKETVSIYQQREASR